LPDAIDDWYLGGAADGFNVMPAVLPSGLELLSEHVVPILQRRGPWPPLPSAASSGPGTGYSDGGER
jgi:hypothetical protein